MVVSELSENIVLIVAFLLVLANHRYNYVDDECFKMKA